MDALIECIINIFGKSWFFKTPKGVRKLGKVRFQNKQAKLSLISQKTLLKI